MKRYIIRNFILIITFLFLFFVPNTNRYTDLKLPWFFIPSFVKYILLFIMFLIISYAYKINNNKSVVNFYFILIINSIVICTNAQPITLFFLLILIMYSSYIVNSLYKQNKASGYLSIPYVIFVSYLLVVNQVIVFIN